MATKPRPARPRARRARVCRCRMANGPRQPSSRCRALRPATRNGSRNTAPRCAAVSGLKQHGHARDGGHGVAQQLEPLGGKRWRGVGEAGHPASGRARPPTSPDPTDRRRGRNTRKTCRPLAINVCGNRLRLHQHDRPAQRREPQRWPRAGLSIAGRPVEVDPGFRLCASRAPPWPASKAARLAVYSGDGAIASRRQYGAALRSGRRGPQRQSAPQPSSVCA